MTLDALAQRLDDGVAALERIADSLERLVELDEEEDEVEPDQNGDV